MSIMLHAPLVQLRVRTQPANGYARRFTEGDAHHDAVADLIKNGGTEGIRRRAHHLTPHAHLHIGIGNHPVQIGQTRCHIHSCAASALLSPNMGASGLKLNTTGQILAGHHIKVDSNSLIGLEIPDRRTFMFLGIQQTVVAIQIVGEMEGGQPNTGNFHFHGRGTVGGRNNHAGGEEESKELLHDAHP